MKTLRILVAATVGAAALLSGCSSDPVALGNRSDQPVPTGKSRTVEGDACGFQLLLIIPINVNGRQQKAYDELLAQANGDYITDVEQQESWFYGFAGTSYCTKFRAKAIEGPAWTPGAKS